MSAILSSDAEIDGTINFDGIMRIEGSVNGKISTDNGELVVSESGIVNATIATKSAVIDGRVDGKITASEKVVLKQKAHLIGDLQSKILVIGVTYKKDIKDLRKSPSLDIISNLERRYVNVSYFDPLIPYLKIGQINLRSIDIKKGTLGNFDCVVVATDHTNLNYRRILKDSKLIFDTRNVYHNIKTDKVARL